MHLNPKLCLRSFFLYHETKVKACCRDVFTVFFENLDFGLLHAKLSFHVDAKKFEFSRKHFRGHGYCSTLW